MGQNSTTNENHKYSQLNGFMKWRQRQIAKEEKIKAEKIKNGIVDDGKEEDEKKKKKRKYMFKDFDMKNWSKVNIYNRGWMRNLYDVYFPFDDIDKQIERAKKKDDDVTLNGDDDGNSPNHQPSENKT